MANFDPVDLRDRNALSGISPVLEAFAHDQDICLAWFFTNNGWDAQGWYNLYWEKTGQPCQLVVRLEGIDRSTIGVSPMPSVRGPVQRCWFCSKEESPAKMRQILEQAKEYAERPR